MELNNSIGSKTDMSQTRIQELLVWKHWQRMQDDRRKVAVSDKNSTYILAFTQAHGYGKADHPGMAKDHQP